MTEEVPDQNAEKVVLRRRPSSALLAMAMLAGMGPAAQDHLTRSVSRLPDVAEPNIRHPRSPASPTVIPERIRRAADKRARRAAKRGPAR